VEPLFSTVHVTNAAGARVDYGKPTPLDDGRMLSLKLRPLPPGVYAVEWHVTSVDTHKTEGHFTFTVKP
jgi:copper resistance protein C